MTRLEQQWPEFAETFGALQVDRQRQIATRAALAGLDAVGLLVPDGYAEAVRAEVERFDVMAWDIQDDESADLSAYDSAFRRARAVDAYSLATNEGDPAEAVYEALHALGAPEAASFLLAL